MTTNDPQPTGFDRLKSWLVGLTGVLVVVPALVNGGIDIYASFAKLPKTESEKLNVELFKKYFNKQPVAAFPVPIKQNNGTVEVRFSVFEEGDVFVEFGKFTQWFPFPKDAPTKVGLSFISQAHAQDTAQLRGFGEFQQNDTLVGGLVIRERRWENGVLEIIQLDPRTGDIVEVKTSRWRPSHDQNDHNQNQNQNPARNVSLFAPIDLDAIRAEQSRPTSPSPTQLELTTTCFTQIGPCNMLRPIPARSQCTCYGPFGYVPGVAK